MLRTLVRIAHHWLSHVSRTDILSRTIATVASKNGLNKASFLDIGCGDMVLTGKLSHKLPHATFYGIDLHPASETVQERCTYRQFDGKTIPYDDLFFDAVLCIDVLHHMDHADQKRLLKEARRVGRIIILKDHMSDGWYADVILRLADWVGNWGKHVASPGTYFREHTYQHLLSSVKLFEKRRVASIDLYAHLPLVHYLYKARWQFVSVLVPYEQKNT